jgi:hypothetical protein
MKDDEDFAGIVRSETTDTVTLIDSLGQTNLLEKSKIDHRKISQISLMPEGLQTGLSLEQFSDLIAFVQNPTPGTPPGNRTGMAALPPNSSLPGPTRSRKEPPPPPPDPLDFLNLPFLQPAAPVAPAAPETAISPPMPEAPATPVVQPANPPSGRHKNRAIRKPPVLPDLPPMPPMPPDPSQ